MTTYFLTDRRATATMRVDDLLHPYPNHNGQFYVNPQQHHMQQQQVQYSNIGAQNCEFLLVHIQCTTCVTRLFGCAARRLVVLLRKKNQCITKFVLLVVLYDVYHNMVN